MNYYGAKELAQSFRTVRKNTIQTAEDIPENQYGFTPAEGTKSIAQTLVHIALSPQLQLAIHSGNRLTTEGTKSIAQTLVHIALSPQLQLAIHSGNRLTTFEGFDFPAAMKQAAEEEGKSRTKAQVLELLRTEGDKWAGFLEGVSEDVLAEPFTMPPGATPSSKSRFEMLLSAKEHEMHHRGQLTLAQRLLGIVPHLTRSREAHAPQPKPAAAAS